MSKKPRECHICSKKFTPNRAWQKYCSPECRNQGKCINALIWRNKQIFNFEGLSLEEIKGKALYNKVYENIMRGFLLKSDKKQVTWSELSWTILYRKSGLSDRTTFNNFINMLCRIGVLKKEGEKYFPSERHKLEPLKLREKDIIMNTDMEHIIFHPSRGHSYMFYNPNINIDEIKSGVKDLDDRIREVEHHLKEAQKTWMNILFDARDTRLREIWMEFLQNNDIYVLTKFAFCLDRIFERVNSLLWEVSRVSSPKKSFAEQWETFIEIQREAFEDYIRKKYPTLNLHQIKELYMKTERDFESNKEAFVKLYNKIINNWAASKLEHLIVVDFLGIDEHRSKELEEIGLKVYSEIDEKTVGEIDDKLKKLSERKQPYDILDDKSTSREYYLNNKVKQPYIETPFFKKFFQGFETDLKDLGFKKDKLDELYEDLDETATILRIPALPDDPADLLQGESLS